MGLVKLPKECLVCLNSSDTTFVPTEESQQVFNICCTYVKDAINIEFLINNIVGNDSSLSFCKNCLDCSNNLSQLVEQLSNLKKEIDNLSSNFAETIAKQRIQATANAFKKQFNNGNSKFQNTENQKADLEFSNEVVAEQIIIEEVVIPILKTESDDVFLDYEEDHVSSDQQDEYETNNLVTEYENELDPLSSSALAASVKMPSVVLRRIRKDGRSSRSCTINSAKTYHNKSEISLNFPDRSSIRKRPGSSIINETKSSKSKKKKIKIRVYKHSCPVCQKRFCSTTDLKRHSWTHTGEKPYKCTMCEKAYRQAQDLRIHERLHTGERPYKCSSCEISFARWNALKDHEKSHVGEKPHKCPHCEMTFMRPNQLKDHEKTHNSEIPQKCSHCEMEFMCPNKLQEHEKTHTTEMTDNSN